MSDRRLDRLEELLEKVLEQPPELREPFLADACGDDLELRREAEELLGVAGEATEFFDGLAGAIAAAAPLEVENAARPRFEVGPYRALEAIGHGGMGVVFRATRVDGAFDREVALKLLHLDMEGMQARARFVAERQLLARLSHPGIAHLLDGGVTEEGRPYFVMELIDGEPITRHCERSSLPLERVLRLFLEVVDAVSYLHRNLVVHRDLKPGNILVDRSGQVKLLDFGIAKVLDEVPGEHGLTRTGELMMTPEYAAPEQLAGAPVTTATDVYALGVLLYELLTGRRPHERRDLRQRTTVELPPTPSSTLRARWRRRPAAPTPAWRRIHADLDTICMKALRPEPEARYPSAEQLGQDVERFLQGLPVRARRSTFGYRATRFVQRHRRWLAAAALMVAALVAGFVHERGLRREAEIARADAQQQAARAEAVSDFLRGLLSSVDPATAQGREVTVADVLEQAAGRIAASPELADQPAVEAAVRRTIGVTYTGLGRYEDAVEHLERAVELLGGMETREPEALQTLSELGVLYAALGRFDEAEAIHRRVLEARTQTLGEEHPDSLRALNRLADLYWAQGRYDEVEAIDRRTLEIRRRVLGEDHPDTLKSLNGLAGTLFTAGRYTEAAELFEQALAAARRQLGDTHPHTLTLGSNLAATYLELGRHRAAESLLREVVEGQVRVLGEDHAETSMSRHNLGVTLAQQARYAEAEEQLRRAIAARERLPGHVSGLLFSRSYLADVYRDWGRPEDAEALYRETLAAQRTELGPEHGDTLKTLQGLAELRARQGDLAAAAELVSDALPVQRRVRGDAHPDTLGSLTTLAAVRNRQGRFAEAEHLARGAVDAGTGRLGAEHPVVLAAACELARAVAGLGRQEAARELATRVASARARVLGAEHPDTVAARRLLAEVE